MSALIPVLKDEEPYVRRSAANALGKIGSTVAVPALQEALSDPEQLVRSSAVEALGDIGTESVIQPLFSALSNPHHSVDREAAEALGNIGSPAAIEALLQAGLEDNLWHWSVMQVLEEIGTEDLLPRLSDLLLSANSLQTLSILRVIDVIQERCQFYNYAIAHASAPDAPSGIRDLI